MRGTLASFLVLASLVGASPALAQSDSVFNDHVVYVNAMNPQDTLMGRKAIPAVYVGTTARARGGSFITDCGQGTVGVAVRDANQTAHFGSIYESVPVRWRFDGGEIQRRDWLVAAGGARIYLIEAFEETGQIIDRARRASRLTVEINTVKKRYTYDFDLTGYSEAIDYGLECLK